MTALHVDLWTNDASAFRIKLVDFGANGVFGGGDDSEHEITLNEGSMPPITTGEWNVLEVPLSAFSGLASRANLAQMIISGSSPTVYLDNVFFYRTVAPEPAEPAPTPTQPADKVISLFSDAYDDVAVDTWSASWDQADVEDVQIGGNTTKKYSNLVFAGIEFTSAPVDATAATHFHFDLWTPDATSSPAALRVKLVDFGADGGFGGGDDTEHEIALTDASDPPLASGEWVSYDIPFEVMDGLAARGHLAQLIIAGDPNTLFLDNLFFHTAVPSSPAEAAPTPTHAADDVISLFSDAYTDATVDTWSATWDQADVEDLLIGGNATKKYTNLVFAGIEFTSSTIDASGMTHFRMDFWTPDATGDPAAFRIKLVDFGADGGFGGGDDTEHEISLTAGTDPALATAQWVSFDIPLTAFTGLTNRGHLAQLIISGDPNTVFVDNIYLRK